MDEQSPLLARVTALLEDPQGSREMIELALECHAAMLGLAESDQVAAIRHALAGSRLLRVLPNREQQPAWVSAHEEQCCRYGALWVKEAFDESETPQSIAWAHQALVLLDRLLLLALLPLDQLLLLVLLLVLLRHLLLVLLLALLLA